MKIYYQGFPGAYSDKASIEIASELNIEKDNIFGLSTFKDVFDKINHGDIGVLPIENSYAGSIYENFYHILSGDYQIIGELNLDIDHCLLANTKDIKDIKYVYSHPQALAQCQNYIEKHGFTPVIYSDTAGAAKFVEESKRKDIASISSGLCSSIYSLNILDKNIKDQEGNTTRFFVIVSKEVYEKNKKKLSLKRNGKISITFKTKNSPSALYKCLGAFATRFINLTKIESLPAKQNRFEYIFWIDFQSNLDENIINDALDELKFFSRDLVVLGNY
ncbi:MAG: prephenate dehydratase [Candidatus Gracilibacteria bacterium]